MFLPVTAYGHPVLRKIAKEIDKEYPDLNKLIDDMFHTMGLSSGVGLAAPQINLSIRLFVIDATPLASKYPSAKDFKRVFINAKKIEKKGDEWLFKEGCLSIPGINEEISRKSNIRMQYYDENFKFHDEKFDGLPARIIQHEYDHTQGILFVDRLSPLKKMLIKRKLNDISKGNIEVSYKMILPLKKKKNK
jgi:peptide deformylase